MCTVVYFEKGFDWFVVMYACTVAAVVLNSFRTAFYSDIWPVGARSLRTLSSPLPLPLPLRQLLLLRALLPRAL
jgi:hypothetical protein